jgi:hypothetical protein
MGFRAAGLLPVICLLMACAEPVPPDYRHYVGVWEAEGVILVIRPDGFLSWARQNGAVKTSLEAPIKEFDGPDLVAGIGWWTTTFRVSTPPRIVNGNWIMVVDEVRLTRTEAFNTPAPAGSDTDKQRI